MSKPIGPLKQRGKLGSTICRFGGNRRTKESFLSAYVSIPLISVDCYLLTAAAVTELDDKIKEYITDMVNEKVDQIFKIRMEAVDSEIDSIKSRMDTADSRSQAQTRKQSKLEHEAESLAGAMDAVRSNQLETERIMRNITLQFARQTSSRR